MEKPIIKSINLPKRTPPEEITIDMARLKNIMDSYDALSEQDVNDDLDLAGYQIQSDVPLTPARRMKLFIFAQLGLNQDGSYHSGLSIDIYRPTVEEILSKD